MEKHWILWAVVMLVIVISTWGGYKRGLLRMLFSTASVIVAIMLASIISPIVQNTLMEHTKLYETLYSNCHSYVQEHVQFQGENVVSVAGQPEFVKNALEPVLEGVNGTIAEAGAAVAANAAKLILSGLSFLATFLVVQIALMVLSNMLHVIDKIPVIHEGNHLAGLLLGFAQGILLIWIFFLLVECAVATPLGVMCSQMIKDNPMLRYMSERNLIVLLVQYFTNGG